MILYFAKINLISHIFEVYDKNLELKQVLNTVMDTFVSGATYEVEEIFKDGTDTNVEKIVYKTHIVEKTEEYIYGYIYKNSKVHYKIFDEKNKQLRPRVVDSNEAITFFFDVYNERIGYNTASRFGYRDFLEAFQGILNNCLSNEENQYKFSVDLCTEGLTLNQITEDLKNIDVIKTLRFKFQPPNPDSEELLAIQQDAEEMLTEYKNANIGSKSVVYTAAKNAGINVDSREVQEQLQNANNIHSEIDAIKATKNGYVEIEATDRYGNKHVTGEKKPIKKEINSIDEFILACKNVIINRCLRNE